ncbi:MAG: hypothetical protein PHY93_18885 [Bacteriovorax sp.]|nr:hypothetical protein [Bacteriovorax sp.]
MSSLFNLLEIKKPSCDGQFMFCDGGGGGNYPTLKVPIASPRFIKHSVSQN